MFDYRFAGMNRISHALVCCLLFFCCGCQKSLEMDKVTAATTSGPQSAIIIKNSSPADIRVTVNNVTHSRYTKTGLTDTAWGTPLTAATIVIETVVTDKQGNPAGQQLVFVYSLQFPADSGIIVKEINVPSTVFFLSVINLSGTDASQLLVTDPSTSNTVNIELPITCAQRETACGYYPSGKMLANVRVISDGPAGRQWIFDGIELPGTSNQRISLTCK